MTLKLPQNSMADPKGLRCLKNTEFQSLGGYSFIELLVVIALLVTVIATGIPLYAAYIEQARITKAAEEISALQKEIQMYKLSKKILPGRLSDIRDADLVDPYGAPYQYHNFTNAHEKKKRRKDRFLVPLNKEYDLYSMGKDGKSGAPLTAKESYDDIVRANNGGYIGPAGEY